MKTVYCADVEIRDQWDDEYSYVTVSACSRLLREKTIRNLEHEHNKQNVVILKSYTKEVK